MEHFRDRLRAVRGKRGWTQRDLAAHTGLTQPHIARLEGGQSYRVEAETIIKLARALGCTSDYLLGLTDEDDAEDAA